MTPNQDNETVTINISTVALLKILVIVLLLAVLYVIRDIILVLLVSMILASAMDPLVDWLYKKARFPRGLSVILVYLVFISAVALVIYFLVPVMIEQFKELGGRLEEFRREIVFETSAIGRVISELGITQAFSGVGEKIAAGAGSFFQTTVGVFSGLIQLLAILAISFYLISSENGMKNFIKSLVPFKHKAYAVGLTEKIQRQIGFWLLGQLILSTFIFALTYIGLTALGVKYALALALLAGLLEIVPYLGPVLSAIPAIFVAFVQAPPLALFVLILYIVVQNLENYVLVPKIMGKTVGANPVVILVAVLVGFQIAGILGMLLAVPIVAAVAVFLKDLRESREEKA